METAHLLEGSPRLLLREQSTASGDPVLYLHGATFPSDCSIMYRFDGVSWADHLNERGFSVYGLDFAGFGGSERYTARTTNEIPGRAQEVYAQIARAVAFIQARHQGRPVSIIAHSWGTIAAGLYAGLNPETVEALVFFGPIILRAGAQRDPPTHPTRLMTIQQQHDRFVEDVPKGQPPVLLDRHFAPWAKKHLASDPASQTCEPPAVMIPTGPAADIAAAWSGEQLFDPARLLMPLLVVRGGWDSLCTDTDVDRLKNATPPCIRFEEVRIEKATHLMHLEEQRGALHDTSARFLRDCLQPVKD